MYERVCLGFYGRNIAIGRAMGREKESYRDRESVRVKGRKGERERDEDERRFENAREREIVLESERLRANVCVRVKERESVKKLEKEVGDRKRTYPEKILKNLMVVVLSELGSFTNRETPKNVKKQRA